MKIGKIVLAAGVLALGAVAVASMKDAEQDQPKFTKAANRDVGYDAKTFEENHGGVPDEARAMNDEIADGVANVDAGEEAFKEAKEASGVEEGIAVARENAAEFAAGMGDGELEKPEAPEAVELPKQTEIRPQAKEFEAPDGFSIEKPEPLDATLGK